MPRDGRNSSSTPPTGKAISHQNRSDCSGRRDRREARAEPARPYPAEWNPKTPEGTGGRGPAQRHLRRRPRRVQSRAPPAAGLCAKTKRGFEKLVIGTEVSFVEETGDKGPQASTVKVIGRLREARRG